MRAGKSQLEAASGTSAKFTNGGHQLRGVGKKHKVAMEQHRGADANRVALDGGNDRTRGLADGAYESMCLDLAGIPTIGLGTEIGDVVSGGEAIAVSLQQNDAHRWIYLGAFQGVRHRAIHGVTQGVLLVRSRQGQRHDTLGYLRFHMFRHDGLSQM
jgi:hypothetical protein